MKKLMEYTQEQRNIIIAFLFGGIVGSVMSIMLF
jgi:hypothetical protein